MMVSWKDEEGFLDGVGEPGDVVSEGVSGRIDNLWGRPLDFLLLAIRCASTMDHLTDVANQKNNEKGSDASSQRVFAAPAESRVEPHLHTLEEQHYDGRRAGEQPHSDLTQRPTPSTQRPLLLACDSAYFVFSVLFTGNL